MLSCTTLRDLGPVGFKGLELQGAFGNLCNVTVRAPYLEMHPMFVIPSLLQSFWEPLLTCCSLHNMQSLTL